MKLLLDTCTFLWIASDAATLSPLARQLFSDPNQEVFLSSVSAWEISVKYALGKLPLPEPPGTFVPAQRIQHGIEVLPLNEEATLSVAALPLLHKDPFDRMLVCQALVHELTILTPDPLIQQYAVPTAW